MCYESPIWLLHEPHVSQRRRLSRLSSSNLGVQAQKIRSRQTRHYLRVLEEVEYIACPSTFCTAPPIPRSATEGGHSNLVLTGRLMQFVLAANFVGLPAITLPVGHDSGGERLAAAIVHAVS